MYILGLSYDFHDSAACLIRDGEIVFAAEEERFTRRKHDNSFPINAIKAALKYEKIEIDDLDKIVYFEKPLRKFDRILNEHLSVAPWGLKRFVKSTQTWLSRKLWTSNTIKSKLGFKGDISFVPHHFSHAAYGFYTGPFKDACIISIDGVGEDSSCSIFHAQNNAIEELYSLPYPDSIGLLYSAFTQYCGFKVNSGEYKLMGLAPYGKPKYAKLIEDNIVAIGDDGSFQLNQKYFNYRSGDKMISSAFEKLLGRSSRQPESEIDQFFKDVASSVQLVTADIIRRIVSFAIDKTSSNNVILTGGVALNCSSNGQLTKQFPDVNFFIPPAPGDNGSAIGAAFLSWHNEFNNDFTPNSPSLKRHVYIGTQYQSQSKFLDTFKINYKECSDAELITNCTDLLTSKKVIGLFRGRMEFGPRALGNRSIIAAPQFEDMQSTVNIAIKKRESFRPFAPITTDKNAKDWFEDLVDQPYMMYTYQCKQAGRISSCVHVDNSARVQVLSKDDNPFLYDLIVAHDKAAAIPVLINTSFNLRGEPIVESPLNALSTFFNCDMDALILNNILILKSENQHLSDSFTIDKKYELD